VGLLLIVLMACNQQQSDAEKLPTFFQPVSLEFREALDIIRDNFLFFDPGLPGNIEDPVSMDDYLHHFDQNSEYLTKSEYGAFKLSQKKVYIGIGMEIEKNDAGEIVCFPYINSPAYKNGIETGDILLSVNRINVSTGSVFSAAVELVGKEGTNVALKVKKRTGTLENINIKRQLVNYEPVTLFKIHGIPVIQIHSFSTSTRRELKFALTEVGRSPVIIIDLRDNPGGDFFQAVDSAMLFLDKGQLISSIKDRKWVQNFKSTTPPFIKPSQIILWQNEKTASSAEVFAAALVENNRAMSIGKKSYGKGTTQTIFELSDGSALFLTVGWLLTPLQTKYHNIGLYPMYEIRAEGSSDKLFFDQTESVLDQGARSSAGRTE